MAAFKSEIHNIDGVLNFYEQHDEAAFRIYAGNKPDAAFCRFEYWDDNKNAGTEKLNDALNALRSNPNNTNQYTLQIIKKVKTTAKGVKPSEFVNVIFQLNSYDGYQPLGNVAGVPQHQNGGFEILLNKLIEQQEKQAALIEKLMQDEPNEIDEQDEPAPIHIQAINGLINNPQIQEMLAAKIIGFLSPKGGGIAGVNPTNQNDAALLNESIERLQKVNPNLASDLCKLADLAEKDAATFNFLIGQLRKF